MAFETVSRMYQIRRTVLEMLRDRGYMIHQARQYMLQVSIAGSFGSVEGWRCKDPRMPPEQPRHDGVF